MSEYIYEEIVNEIIIDGVDCSTVRIGEQREEIVRCVDCRYYLDHKWFLITDVPHVCTRWGGGDGVQVKPYGYCFLGERREDA